MRRFTTVLLIVLLAVISRGFALAAWPSVEGEVAGELKLFDRSPEFVLPWKLAFSKGEGGEQAFTCKIATSSTQLLASGRMNLATGDGFWRIEEARVDVAIWLALVAPQLGSVLSGATAQGTFTVSGEGTLHEGKAVGRLVIEWRDGVLVHAEQGWKLEGIAFKGEFVVDLESLQVVSAKPFELKIGTITHPRFGARNLSLLAVLTERRSLQISAAQVEVAGGDMVADPSEWPLVPLAVDINLHIHRVGLQDIVFLVPAAGLADARGRIDGVVRVKWNAEQSLHFGLGDLAVSNDEPAVVRLTPSLGLLTGKLPQYFDLLPSWTGPLARWTRQKNPAYKNMQNIELGKEELQVKTLTIHLTPEGDTLGRSATVRFVAEPTEQGSAVKQVTFDINVAGPLNEVLKLGIEQGFSVDMH